MSMESLSLPFLFFWLLTMWFAVEWTLRAQRRREAEKEKQEREAEREASRRRRLS